MITDSEEIRFSVGDNRVWKLGPLEIVICRTRREWRIGHRYDLREEVKSRRAFGEKVESVPALEWTRWPASDDAKTVSFRPLMPDRPVVVRPDAPITLNPGRSVDFFAGIPMWLGVIEVFHDPVSQTTRVGQSLGEVATRPLSDTWIGDLDKGEFCYASITSARRFIDELDERPNRVICKLEVRNDNDQPLVIERICLRTIFLEIYQGATSFWSPEGRIIYRGLNQANQIIFAKSAPPFDNVGPEVVGGRIGEVRRGRFARGISAVQEKRR